MVFYGTSCCRRSDQGDLAVITTGAVARPALRPRRVVRPRDVVKKTPLHQMPAVIPEAERPDELPVRTIQTTINSKITAAVLVRTRAPHSKIEPPKENNKALEERTKKARADEESFHRRRRVQCHRWRAAMRVARGRGTTRLDTARRCATSHDLFGVRASAAHVAACECVRCTVLHLGVLGPPRRRGAVVL